MVECLELTTPATGRGTLTRQGLTSTQQAPSFSECNSQRRNHARLLPIATTCSNALAEWSAVAVRAHLFPSYRRLIAIGELHHVAESVPTGHDSGLVDGRGAVRVHRLEKFEEKPKRLHGGRAGGGQD